MHRPYISLLSYFECLLLKFILLFHIYSPFKKITFHRKLWMYHRAAKLRIPFQNHFTFFRNPFRNPIQCTRNREVSFKVQPTRKFLGRVLTYWQTGIASFGWISNGTPGNSILFRGFRLESAERSNTSNPTQKLHFDHSTYSLGRTEFRSS